MLDEQIECSECHRVFFAKTTAGKRVAAPDYTKVYIGFGVAAVAIIGLFVLSGGKKEPIKPKKKPVVEKPRFGRGDHPRALGLSAWATSIGSNNQLVLTRHTDLPAMSKFLELEASDAVTVMNALQTLESTELLRSMDCGSAQLDTEADMTAASGSGIIYVTPKPTDDRWKRNTNGKFAVTFTTDGDTVKVSSFKNVMMPMYAPGKRPLKRSFTPNQDIARPDVVSITDSAGTREVNESAATAMPHHKDATAEQRTLADEVVADILRFATDDSAPGGLFNRATMKVRSNEDKKAVFPRVLNAMFECYPDPIANHQKLILLTRALRSWSGYAVNYSPIPSGNDEADKKLRQSCIRQWFAFWYRYHENWEEFFDSRENLEDDEEEDEGGGK